MYTDIIHYDLAPHITTANFLVLLKKVKEDWMLHQEGFISWSQHNNSQGHFTDIVHWKSKTTAKKAETQMEKNPHHKAWVACYQNIRAETLESLETDPTAE